MLVAVLVEVEVGMGVSVTGGGGVNRVARAWKAVKSIDGVAVTAPMGVIVNGRPQAITQMIITTAMIA